MNKLNMQTPNLIDKNIERIAALFPNVITEMEDENGQIKKGINFDLLKQELSGDIVESGEECYDFTWVGKNQAILEGNMPIRKTLRPCKEESKNWETTENLYIEGDNLDVLKLLQESYLNSIKMIYIDPPYNTGNDFIYKDDFTISREEYNEQTGVYDDEDNRLVQNAESNGRFHSDWCSMLYPRLKLANNLLTEDGVIFISIDDNEVHNLRKICDEVFGESNFLACLIWEKTRKNDARFFSSGHDYMIVYARNEALLRQQNTYWREDKPGADDIFKEYEKLLTLYGTDYSKMEEELRKFYNTLPKNHPAKKHSRYNKIDDKGVWRDDNMSWPGGGGPTYNVIHPKTGLPCKVPPGGWRFSTPESMQENIDAGIVVFREDHTEPPIRKTYLVRRLGKHSLDDSEDIGKQVMGSYFYRSFLQASNVISDLLGKGVFEYPKDHEVLERIIGYVTNKESVILDFFSGSASTAHAVMQLNAADDGNRKHIMVQLPEKCDEKSEAYKAGFKTIAEIGKERIRRAGEQIKKEIEENDQQLKMDETPKKVPDIGFRVLKVDSTNMKDVYYSANEYNQNMLSALESNIKEDRTDMDLLYQVLLDWGLPLSLKHVTEKIGGVNVHTVDDGALMACFDANVPESVIREMAKRKPLRVVFRDSSFADSPSKINVEEIFKLNTPGTDVRVI